MTIDRDPICIEAGHKRRGIVSNAPMHEDGPHASVYVCARKECIDDAKAWVYEVTGKEGVHRPDPYYPEHDKLKEIADKSQLVGEFLDWLRYDQEIVLMREPDNPNNHPTHERRNTEQLLADFFGINLEVLNKEKRDILEAQRELNRQAGIG